MLALALALTATLSTAAYGDGQQYEELSDSVRSSLRQLVTQQTKPHLFFDSPEEGKRWLSAMSKRLAAVLPAESIFQELAVRHQLLTEVHYEAGRAGLDPQVVLAVMHVESAFRKYAISIAGARGLMQVMPFWVHEIGDGDDRKLFQTRTNLRYGAVILRHYLDLEKGNLTRALARYNGSLGSNRYPRLVYTKLKQHWHWLADNQ